MIPFITYKENYPNGEEHYFILQKEFPHLLCEVSSIPKIYFVPPMPISNYNLFIEFNGCLRGNVIPSYKDIGEEIKSVMYSMSVWFFEQRILPNEKKYKKWKIQ